eukprot:389274_1
MVSIFFGIPGAHKVLKKLLIDNPDIISMKVSVVEKYPEESEPEAVEDVKRYIDNNIDCSSMNLDQCLNVICNLQSEHRSNAVQQLTSIFDKIIQYPDRLQYQILKSAGLELKFRNCKAGLQILQIAGFGANCGNFNDVKVWKFNIDKLHQLKAVNGALTTRFSDIVKYNEEIKSLRKQKQLLLMKSSIINEQWVQMFENEYALLEPMRNIECNSLHVSECPHTARLYLALQHYFLSQHIKIYFSLQSMKTETNLFKNILPFMLDDYLHLLMHHDSPAEYDFIAESFDECDINQCKIFNRNYRDRNQSVDDQTNMMKLYYGDSNASEVAVFQTLDKMHCYYYHRYDIGHKLCRKDMISLCQQLLVQRVPFDHLEDHWLINEINLRRQQLSMQRRQCFDTCNVINNRLRNRYNQLCENNNQLQEETKQNQFYCFGYNFKYGYSEEFTPANCIYVEPKYSSLKEELVNNTVSCVLLAQFNVEYRKAQSYLASGYCKKHFKPYKGIYKNDSKILWQFGIHHILSLMIYCNFDTLQYFFSKTYRDNQGTQHANFYHLGKYLKISIRKFGSNVRSDVHYYHGMSKKLEFSKYIGEHFNLCGVSILCPLSTSSALEVAANFTNQNQGLIAEFGYGGGHLTTFSTSWLSDYSNEKEYLFVQNNWPLSVNNIIDPGCGYEYKILLNVLQILFDMTHVYRPIQPQLDEGGVCLMFNIVAHQLSLSLPSYQQNKYLTDYAKSIINTFFDNQKYISLDSYLMRNTKYSMVFQIFNQIQYGYAIGYNKEILQALFWIQMKNIMLLFPNLETLRVLHINLSQYIMDDIFKNLLMFSGIKCVIIKVNENSVMSIQCAIEQYTEQFGRNGFILDRYLDDRLRIEHHESNVSELIYGGQHGSW